MAKLPQDAFLSWGWRVPFLLSAVLFVIGAFIRMRVAETPVFLDMKNSMAVVKSPLLGTLTEGRRSFLVAVGLKLCEVSWIYLLTVFVVVYATTTLKLPKPLILNAIFYGALLELITVPIFGWLSDIIGRRPFFFIGTIFTVAFAYPLFWMLDSKSAGLVTLAIIIAMNFGHGLMFASESTYFPELFKGPVRCTGASVGFQLSAAIGGGISPILATWLVGLTGGTTGVSIMLIILAAVTFVAALFARETLHETLTA